jgi:hypothetical protein
MGHHTIPYHVFSVSCSNCRLPQRGLPAARPSAHSPPHRCISALGTCPLQHGQVPTDRQPCMSQSHTQPLVTAHCSTSRCPPAAARARMAPTRGRVRAAISPNRASRGTPHE